jgi:hypothetical protein
VQDPIEGESRQFRSDLKEIHQNLIGLPIDLREKQRVPRALDTICPSASTASVDLESSIPRASADRSRELKKKEKGVDLTRLGTEGVCPLATAGPVEGSCPA